MAFFPRWSVSFELDVLLLVDASPRETRPSSSIARTVASNADSSPLDPHSSPDPDPHGTLIAPFLLCGARLKARGLRLEGDGETFRSAASFEASALGPWCTPRSARRAAKRGRLSASRDSTPINDERVNRIVVHIALCVAIARQGHTQHTRVDRDSNTHGRETRCVSPLIDVEITTLRRPRPLSNTTRNDHPARTVSPSLRWRVARVRNTSRVACPVACRVSRTCARSSCQTVLSFETRRSVFFGQSTSSILEIYFISDSLQKNVQPHWLATRGGATAKL